MSKSKETSKSSPSEGKPFTREEIEIQLDRSREKLLVFVQSLLGQRNLNVDAADIVQEVSAFVLANPSRFVQPKYESSFLAWLKQIARNKIGNLIKKRSETDIDLLITASGSLQVASRSKTPSSHLNRKELADRLLQAIDGLSETDRNMIKMRHFEKLSFEDMADRTSKAAPNSARRAYWRAVENLRKKYLSLAKGK